MSNLDTITAFLKGKGLSSAQVAGVEGNLQVESNFNPAASNAREGAVGIAQWEGGRRTALQAYAAAHGTSETDLNTQLGFMWSELTGSESGALAALQAASTPVAAATAFDQQYERSSTASLPQRQQAANNIADGGSIWDGVTTTAGQVGGAAASAASALNPFSGWQTSLLKIALMLAGAAATGALVIVGAKETVKGSS